MAVVALRLAAVNQICLHYSIQRQSIDDLAWPFGKDDADGALEGEVDEEGDVIRTLLASRQRCEN